MSGFGIVLLLLLNWYFVSTFSYYNGYKRGMAYNASSLMKALKYNIEKMNLTDADSLLSEIHDVFDNIEGEKTIFVSNIDGSNEIIIYHNIKKYFQRSPDDYNLESAEYTKISKKHDEKLSFVWDNKKYRLEHKFLGSPKTLTGIIRAITFSLGDFYRYSMNNSEYIEKRFFERSWNFWVPFSFVFIFFFFVMKKNISYEKMISDSFHNIKMSNKELENVNFKLKERSKKLEKTLNDLEVFKYTYNKIQKDFSNSVHNSGNNLQSIESSWEEFQRKSLGLERHDYINEWRSLRNIEINGINKNIIEYVYDKFLEPAIKKIHKDLKNLDKILDIKLEKKTLEEMISIFNTNNEGSRVAIPIFPKEVSFYKKIDIKNYENFYCMIIEDKIQSIIFNVLNNSMESIERQYMLINYDLNYNPFIKLSIFIKKFNNQNYVVFEILDNGEGFDDDIVNDVYKKPVRAKKEYYKGDKRDYGEATTYIGFFVSLMNGDAYAENIILNENQCAKTTILIPIFKEGLQNEYN